MKGATGTSMQGRVYIKKTKARRRKSNCRQCMYGKYYKPTDCITCTAYHENKFGDQWRKKRFCRRYVNIEELRHI